MATILTPSGPFEKGTLRSITCRHNSPAHGQPPQAVGGLLVKVAYTMVMDEVASTTSLVLRQYVTFHVDNIFFQFAYVIVEAFVTESKFDFAPLLKNHQNLPSSNLS